MPGCRTTRSMMLLAALMLTLAACAGESGPTTTAAAAATSTTEAATTTTTTAAATTTSTTEATSAYDDLIAAAQAEGELVLYSAESAEIMDEYTSAFTDKYGIVVSFQRLPAGESKTRVEQEIEAGRLDTDIVGMTNDPVWTEKMLEQLAEPDPDVLPNLAAVPEEMRHGTHVEARQAFYGFVYNTDELSAEDVPTDLRDLLSMEGITGRIGTSHPGVSNFFATWHTVIYDLWGQESYEEFWRSFLQDHEGFVSDVPALVQGVAAGELLFVGPTNYGQISPLVDQGAPVAIAYIDPVLRVPVSLFTFKDSPHPNAASLFIDFYLSEEAQTILCGGGECGSHLDIPGEASLPSGIEPIEPDVLRGAEFGAEYIIPNFDTLISS